MGNLPLLLGLALVRLYIGGLPARDVTSSSASVLVGRSQCGYSNKQLHTNKPVRGFTMEIHPLIQLFVVIFGPWVLGLLPIAVFKIYELRDERKTRV